MFSIQRSRFTDEQIALVLQQGSKKMQVMINTPEIAYFLPKSQMIKNSQKVSL